MKRGRRGLWAGAAAGLLAIGLAAIGAIRRPATTPTMRGAALAAELGCFGCHGPGGTGGVANPGSVDGEIPSWDGGTAAMYVEHASEVAEWILDGRPRRLKGVNAPGLISMPAYRAHLRDTQLADLIAYFRAVSGMEAIPAAAVAGRRAASRLGCFGCHGPGGRTGSPNPRGWKGIIPAWDSDDFAELVRDDTELRTWVLDGAIPRLRDDVVARQFLDRQPIQMPAYREQLAVGELDAMVAYIQWLRGAGAKEKAP